MQRNHQHNQQKYVKKPLLHRLRTTDNAFSDAPQNYVDLDAIYEDIRQNLEYLLNSRVRYIQNLIGYSELNESLANYGLKDFMHSSFGTKAMQNRLCDEIEKIITYFEPRIINPKVDLQDSEEDDISRILKLRIEGTVKALDDNVPAVFESSMDLNKHNFNVE